MYDNNGNDDDAQDDNYDFFANDDKELASNTPAVTKWKLGNHPARPSIDADLLRANADMVEGLDDELAEMFREAANRVPTANLKDWECPVCGLPHGHSDSKHDIRVPSPDGFGVLPEFAERMQFNAACHCGVNELAVLVDYYEHISVPVFDDEDSLHDRDLEQRFTDIRAAADNADISKLTQNKLDNIRETLERKFE